MIFQNHPWVKALFTVQDRPMDFNITGYEKFIDVILDFILQLTFQKYSLSGID